MKRLLLGLTFGVMLALIPLTASADDGDNGNILIRINGDVTVARGEELDTVVVIRGDAIIEGTVHDAVVVVRGDLTVRGAVEGSITAINGDVILENGSTVEDVHIVRGDLDQAAGATITGDVNRNADFSFRGAWIWFSVVFWVGATVFLIGAALLFAAIGGRQLSAAAASMTSRTGPSLLAALALWIGLPIIGVIFLITVVGIPIGLAILLLGLPALWILGYITAGARLGAAVTGSLGRTPGEHPYLAAFLGVVILQILVVIPVIGWLVGAVAGFWGAGAVGLIAYNAARGETARPAVAQPDAGPPAASA